MKEDTTVLIISGFGVWKKGVPKVGKIESHLGPIGAAADEAVFVCTGPTADSMDGLDYKQVKPSKSKLLTLLKQFLVALRLSLFNDFDIVITYSLVPYGLFGLTVGKLTRTPVHLGIIGSDLDVHAHGKYSRFVKWCFRRFDTISVKGSGYEEQLLIYGVSRERIFQLFNPPSRKFELATPNTEPTYDILWLARMSTEKNPLLFVDILTELRDRDVGFSAAMVGGGPLEEVVHAAVLERGLEEMVDLPGWSDNPIDYFEDASMYVLTSDRDMLPISLLEAMYCGAVPIAPSLGAIPDLIQDRENGILIEDDQASKYAEPIARLLNNDCERQQLSEKATIIKQQISYDASADTWEEIINNL
ncbi:glycosyltransferase [Natrialbaceae archaeon A-CW2]